MLFIDLLIYQNYFYKMKKIIYFIIIYNIIITIQEKNYNQVTSNEVEIRKELQIPLEAKWVIKIYISI